ncbi:hypothetical protein ACGCUQ_08250 [Eubacteriales bacterium KG127]
MKKLTKVIAVMIIAMMTLPLYTFGTVADLASDSKTPGISLAGKYPAYNDIKLQIPLTEEK